MVVLGAFFSVALFLCVLLFSFSQVTEPDRVKNYIGFGIAALTEIDQHLFNELPDLKEAVRGSEDTVFLLPNFPLDISQRAINHLWRVCESYELWCKETKNTKLIKLSIIE